MQASKQRWKECFLGNFTGVAHNLTTQDLLFLSKELTPNLLVLDSLCAAGLPRNIGPIKLCEELSIGDISISDIDFSTPDIQKKFKAHLQEQHPTSKIVRLNLFTSGEKGNTQLVRVSRERFPRIGQLIDFGLPFLGLPNARLKRAYQGEYS